MKIHPFVFLPSPSLTKNQVTWTCARSHPLMGVLTTCGFSKPPIIGLIYNPPRNKDGNNGSLDPGNMCLLNIFKLATSLFWPFSPWRKTMVVGFWARRLCIGIQLSKWFVKYGIFLALGRGGTDKRGAAECSHLEAILAARSSQTEGRKLQEGGRPQSKRQTTIDHWQFPLLGNAFGKVCTVLHLCGGRPMWAMSDYKNCRGKAIFYGNGFSLGATLPWKYPTFSC